MILPLLLGLCSPAAAADTWLYYNGAYLGAADVAPLVDTLSAIGATVSTTTSSVWPTTWTGTRLVIILLPDASFSTAQANALKGFVNSGGRLVVAGDDGSAGGFSLNNGYLNSMLSTIGAGMSIGSSLIAGTASGCVTTNTFAADQLTAGVTRVYTTNAAPITGGTALISYTGSSLLSVGQLPGAAAARSPYDVVVAGDVNLFLDSCPGATSPGLNVALWENLYDTCTDADLDGHGDPSCGGDDCDEADASIHPDATELPYDGIDQDCDGLDPTDVDGDGHLSVLVTGGDDCADTLPASFPGAAEVADGVDNDCDGAVDEGTTAADDDGDGFTEEGGDCDDASAAASPALAELPDSLDNDCDGLVDEGTTAADDDGDGLSEVEGDCDDGDPAIHPGAADTPDDGLDNDCDGLTDGFAPDADADGFTTAAGDCDDHDPATHPHAEELPDGRDNDCDGATDEGTTAADDDGDGFSEEEGDCDDSAAATSPAAAEDPNNGQDDDCDGTIDEGGPYADDDGDGFTEEGGDCDDADPAVHPGAADQPGLDANCDGLDDTHDPDGDGQTAAAGDCDEADPWVHAAAIEVCDDRDNDCDGRIDEGCGAADGAGGGAKGCATAAGGALPLALLALLPRRRRIRGPVL